MTKQTTLEQIRKALAGRTAGEWQWHGRVYEDATTQEVIGYDRLEAHDEVEGGEDVIAWRKAAWLAVKPADAEIIENAPEWLEELVDTVDKLKKLIEVPLESLGTTWTEDHDSVIRWQKQVRELLGGLK